MHRPIEQATNSGSGVESEPTPVATADEEQLWRSVDRDLLVIGKNGVAASHCTSLVDLVSHHPMGVKVRVNHSRVNLEEAVLKLSEDPSVEFVLRKGSTLLFKKSS